MGHRREPADVAQRVAGVELTTAARSTLTGMPVELLTMLTCWPNTSRPAHALAYLRTRRARTVPPRSLVLPTASAGGMVVGGDKPGDSPPRLRRQRAGIDEKARQAWRSGSQLSMNTPGHHGAVSWGQAKGLSRARRQWACVHPTPLPGPNECPSHDAKVPSRRALEWEEPRGTSVGVRVVADAVAQLAGVVVSLS